MGNGILCHGACAARGKPLCPNDSLAQAVAGPAFHKQEEAWCKNKGAHPMFRKLLFIGIAAVTFLLPGVFISSAQAQEGRYLDYPYHHRYTVVYRTSPFDPWRVYGVFHGNRAAQNTAASLRFQGFPARVIYR